MSNQVNWKKLFRSDKNLFVCKTKEEVEYLLQIAHDLGYKWNSGDSFLENIYFRAPGIYYRINTGLRGNINFLDEKIREGNTAYYVEELIKQDKMKKSFTKQDFLNKKIAIQWEKDKADKINAFFKGCNKDNTLATGHSTYYFTRYTTNPGYYDGCNSLEALAEEGITEVYTIDQLIKEGMTQTISRQNLGKIYPEVCSKWQGKIDEVLAEQKFATDIEVSEDDLKEAFKEANSDQKTALRHYFNEPILGFQAKDLKIGEIMKVTKGDNIFEGKHIMRIYERLVCLEDPQNTWDYVDTCNIEGTKLAAGSSVIITAK
jgi:hypothetical protein